MHDSRYSVKHGLFSKLLDVLLVCTFRFVNRYIPWHRLPALLGLPNLIAFRVELRDHNLYDTDGELSKEKPGCPFHSGPNSHKMRTLTGTQNDLKHPAMGCRFSRLGRNMLPLTPADVESDLLIPNPLLISQQLLARENFIPATSLNLLAAAWIQFQVHDWFSHEKEPLKAKEGEPEPDPIRLDKAGDWDEPEHVSRRTKPDPSNSKPLNARYPAFRNEDPQWWDGSQIYGEEPNELRRLRTDPATGQLCPHGQLHLKNGLLPTDSETGTILSGFTDNWWLGLEILHTLFVKEHNAICLTLHKDESHLGGQEIFERARLVNCALMAKIHTIEWTPGILAHPAITPALNANWMGMLGHWFGEGLARKIARFLPDNLLKDVLTGIPLSETDHHGAPYALTEEFASVYRLHPLIPDRVEIHSATTGESLAAYDMKQIAFSESRTPLNDGAVMEDLIYSFGTEHPGAITIHNYPAFLRNLTLPPDPQTNIVERMDLAAVDILRDRERGVPRYNEFRKQLRMKEILCWNELSGGRPELAEKLKAVYNDDLSKVDTMVGMFCEPLPEGFGFSDTAFRIFILMASRRLKSDRYFTTDFTEEVYTKTGLDWIRRTGMKEIILRHHPSLEPAFHGNRNPFAPWTRTGRSSPGKDPVK